MHLYYQGYPAGMQQHLHNKLTHEKERLMHVADQAHVASFSRFIDSDGESELDYSSNLPAANLMHNKSAIAKVDGGGASTVRSNKCTHCRAQIFEAGSS